MLRYTSYTKTEILYQYTKPVSTLYIYINKLCIQTPWYSECEPNCLNLHMLALNVLSAHRSFVFSLVCVYSVMA